MLLLTLLQRREAVAATAEAEGDQKGEQVVLVVRNVDLDDDSCKGQGKEHNS
jgi:hypothetical protein